MRADSPLDAELAQRRNQLQLRRDAAGRFTSAGELVRHPRIAAWLLANVDFDEATNLYVIRDGAKWAELGVEDTPLFVESAALHDDNALRVRLDDGREMTIAVDELRYDRLELLWARVPSQPTGTWMPARLRNHALAAIGNWLHADNNGAYYVQVTAMRHAVRQAEVQTRFTDVAADST